MSLEERLDNMLDSLDTCKRSEEMAMVLKTFAIMGIAFIIFRG